MAGSLRINVRVRPNETWRALFRIEFRNPSSAPPLGSSVQAAQGADIIEIVTYRWSLPEDTAPLRRLIGALGRDEIDLGAFTSARQASNLFTVAQNDSKEGLLEQSLAEHSSLQSARSAASRSGSLPCGSISKQNRQSSDRLSRQSTRHCPTGVRWANHNAGRFGAKPQLALSRITGNAIRNWYN